MLNIISDYKISWFSATFMTIGLPTFEQIFPYIGNLIIILIIQLISVLIDVIRKKFNVEKKESKTDIEKIKEIFDSIKK